MKSITTNKKVGADIINKIRKEWEAHKDPLRLFNLYRREQAVLKYHAGYWEITRFVYLLSQGGERNDYWLNLFIEGKEGRRSFMDSEELKRFDLLPKEMKVYVVASADGWHRPIDYILNKSFAEMMFDHLKNAGGNPVLVERTVEKKQIFAYMRVAQFDLVIIMDEEWLNDQTDYIMQKNGF